MKFLKENISEKIRLEYDSIPITIYGHQRDADDWDEREDEISWTYKVDKDDVEYLLQDIVEAKLNIEYPESEKYVKDNFDKLFNENEAKILNYFRDNAIEDAQENNDEEYNPGPDPDDYR